MAFRPHNSQERIIHRLQISQGHLEKIIEMTKNQVYCIDIMHQIKALERALQETGNVLLENHLTTCLTEAIVKGKKNEAINEIIQVFKKSS